VASTMKMAPAVAPTMTAATMATAAVAPAMAAASVPPTASAQRRARQHGRQNKNGNPGNQP
jgi:hypothetical protein